MSKMDELRQSVGSNVDESMGGGRSVRSPIPGVSASGPRSVPGKLQGVVRINNAAEIPVDKIGPDDDQPREEFDDDALDRLGESLKQRGQLQPIRVRWSEERGQYVIICGERRWRAATRAGISTISCIIVERPISPEELLALQCVENLLREDLSDMEQAKAFRSLMETNGWSTHQIAKELGIVQPSVVRALALLKLPESIQEQVEQGTMKAATAYQIAKLDDPETQVALAARVVSEGLSRDQTVEVIRQAASRPKAGSSKGRGATKGKAKLPTERTLKTSGGLKVTVAGRKGFEVLAWLEALEDATRQVRAQLPTASEPESNQEAA